MIKRNGKGQFDKGNVSGNAGKGRPLKKNTFADAARELLLSDKIDIQIEFSNKEKKEISISCNQNFQYLLIAILINEGISGNIQAIRELINRAFGKPVQPIELETNERIKFTGENAEEFLLNELKRGKN